MKRYLSLSIFVVVLFIPLLVFAAAGATDTDFVSEWAKAVKGGDWQNVIATSLILIGTVAGVRRALGGVVPWFATDRGGTVLVFALSLCGAIGTSLYTTQSFSLQLVIAAFGVALGAIGGYTGLKRILSPTDQRE